MSGHDITLDKQPGFHPSVIGETWRCLFAKCVLRVTGPEATSVCQGDQICSVHKAVIDGAVHGVQAIWDTKSTTEYWGFILVYAKKSLNEINEIVMMWAVCY